MISIFMSIIFAYVFTAALSYVLLNIKLAEHSFVKENNNVLCEFKSKYLGRFDLIINPSAKAIYESKTSKIYRIKRMLAPMSINNELSWAIDAYQSRYSFYLHNDEPTVFVLTSDTKNPLFSLHHEAAHAMISKEDLIERLCGDKYKGFKNIFFLFTLYCIKNNLLPADVNKIDRIALDRIYALLEECVCDLYAIYESDGAHMSYLRKLRSKSSCDDKTHNTILVVEKAFDENYKRRSPVNNLEKAFSGIMYAVQDTNAIDIAIENLADM